MIGVVQHVKLLDTLVKCPIGLAWKSHRYFNEFNEFNHAI